MWRSRKPQIKLHKLLPILVYYWTKLIIAGSIDLSPYEWNFDLDKPGQKFHSLKERHKISNTPKFRCEML
jgi:hypothetical protein